MPVPRTHRIVRGQAVLDIIEEGPAGAPCITCLHALATDLHLWDDQAPALTQSHRVLRLDMRGHGGSSVGDTSYSIDELALDVVAVWDSLGIERSTVLGLSIGAARRARREASTMRERKNTSSSNVACMFMSS